MINGLAITAGSNPSLFARIGSEQPTSFAITTVQRIVRLITSATSMVTLSMRSSLIKFVTASVAPQRTDTLSSFHRTLNVSANVISWSEIPRITVTDAWLPQLPPVSIIIGIDAASTRYAERASSKCVIIAPVNAAEIISMRSHGIRLL